MVGGLEDLDYSMGISSSQLTKSYFSEGWLNHQPGKERFAGAPSAKAVLGPMMGHVLDPSTLAPWIFGCHRLCRCSFFVLQNCRFSNTLWLFHLLLKHNGNTWVCLKIIGYLQNLRDSWLFLWYTSFSDTAK